MNSRTLKASWLREHADIPSGVLPLSVSLCPVLADALDIADSCARSDIECNCSVSHAAPIRWYDTTDVDPSNEFGRDAIALAVRYLTARGLVEIDPVAPHLVRLLDEPKPE